MTTFDPIARSKSIPEMVAAWGVLDPAFEAQRDFHALGIKMPKRYTVGIHRLQDDAGNMVVLDVCAASKDALDFSMKRETDGFAVPRWKSGLDGEIKFPQTLEQAEIAARWLSDVTDLEITADMVLEAQFPDEVPEWYAPPAECELHVEDVHGMLHVEAKTETGIFWWPLCQTERKARPIKPPAPPLAISTAAPKASPQVAGKSQPSPAHEPAIATNKILAGMSRPKPVAPTGTIELLRGSDIQPAAIDWLWNGWLAAGKLHILGGAPGTGKTTISMALAATVTTGERWPDGTRSVVGNVVIWSGEDDPADTLVPRLALAGADLSRVYFINDVFDGNGRRSFDPARDMEPLRRKLAEIGDVRLLIVDPIVSAVMGDSHKNAEVRRSLQPLVDLASAMRCALIGITHFSKGTGGRDPIERLTGSLAFGALARVVLVAAKNQEEGEDGRTVRIFLRAKSNIGPDDGGFEYDLQQGELKTHPGIFSSSVLWGNTLEGAARELLATADATSDDGEGGTMTDAKSFLTDLLADGSLPTKAIKADADGAGYSWATIRRAQKSLEIEAFKDGMNGGWKWRLSRRCSKNIEDAQQNSVSTFREIEHLQDEYDEF